MGRQDSGGANRAEGSVIAEKYRLVRLLGRGGMGAVYEARNEWTGRRVAVKVMHGSKSRDHAATQRFLREARAATRIAHPNIVEVLDMGQDGDGPLYIVQEFLVGTDLRSVLLQRKTLPPLEALDAIMPVMAALSAAHRAGVVHRDIKPENIFLTRTADGARVSKLIDFGIAKMDADEHDSLGLTRPGMAMGTPHYMSPEQARGDREIDPQTDVWAIGTVLFETLAGKYPFEGANYNQLLARILLHPVPLLVEVAPGLPPKLCAAVQRALARERAERYPNMALFLAALVDAADFASPAWRAETRAWLGRQLGFNLADGDEDDDDVPTEMVLSDVLKRAAQDSGSAANHAVDPAVHQAETREAPAATSGALATGEGPRLDVTLEHPVGEPVAQRVAPPRLGANRASAPVSLREPSGGHDVGEEGGTLPDQRRPEQALLAAIDGEPPLVVPPAAPAPVAPAAPPPGPSTAAASAAAGALRKPKVGARSGQTVLGLGDDAQIAAAAAAAAAGFPMTRADTNGAALELPPAGAGAPAPLAQPWSAPVASSYAPAASSYAPSEPHAPGPLALHAAPSPAPSPSDAGYGYGAPASYAPAPASGVYPPTSAPPSQPSLAALGPARVPRRSNALLVAAIAAVVFALLVLAAVLLRGHP